MSDATRLLLVQRDRGARHLAPALRRLGHTVDVACSGPAGLAHALGCPYDAILIACDLRPTAQGDFVTRCRAAGLTCPILVLGIQGGAPHVVRALDAGADGYLAGPVHPGEVAARIRAFLRRLGGDGSPRMTVGDLSLDLARRQAFVGNRLLRATPKEFELLRCLMRGAPELVSRRELLRQVWSAGGDPSSNAIEVHMSRLRAKLRELGQASASPL